MRNVGEGGAVRREEMRHAALDSGVACVGVRGWGIHGLVERGAPWVHGGRIHDMDDFQRRMIGGGKGDAALERVLRDV